MRISNDENIKEDINIYKVYKQLSKTLKKIYPPDLVKAFLIYTPMQKIKHSTNAMFINQNIITKMNKYFKI